MEIDLEKLFSSDTKAALICYRTADHPSPAIRSTRQKCIKCSEEVWSSPASLAAAGKDSVIVCMICALPLMIKHGEEKFMGTSPGQLREMGLGPDEGPKVREGLVDLLRKLKGHDA